jgi:hypothetical protein
VKSDALNYTEIPLKSLVFESHSSGNGWTENSLVYIQHRDKRRDFNQMYEFFQLLSSSEVSTERTGKIPSSQFLPGGSFSPQFASNLLEHETQWGKETVHLWEAGQECWPFTACFPLPCFRGKARSSTPPGNKFVHASKTQFLQLWLSDWLICHLAV